jgi:signal transduction histidine kinase
MTKILIVDDEPLNRELIHAYLDGLGYTLVDVGSGEQALAAVEAHPPDLILLDVMLPGLSGFETAARIKAKTEDPFLPIIMLTALADQESRLRGLRSGADEFLTKPVDRNELLLRVGHLLSLRTKDAALMQRNIELAELQRFRDEMSAMLVHDMKNPLSVMVTNTEYVIDLCTPDQADQLEALHDVRSAGRRALRIVANLLEIARMEAGSFQIRREPTDVAAVVEPLVRERTFMAEVRDIELRCTIDPAATMVADREILSRVLENVFDNAFRYTPAGGRIEVQGFSAEHSVQLRIGNTGSPIPVEDRARIFERFAQATGNVGRMNLGLGLYFCRLAAEAHGGRIWVEQTPELPTVFGLELPV